MDRLCRIGIPFFYILFEITKDVDRFISAVINRSLWFVKKERISGCEKQIDRS